MITINNTPTVFREKSKIVSIDSSVMENIVVFPAGSSKIDLLHRFWVGI